MNKMMCTVLIHVIDIRIAWPWPSYTLRLNPRRPWLCTFTLPRSSKNAPFKPLSFSFPSLRGIVSKCMDDYAIQAPVISVSCLDSVSINLATREDGCCAKRCWAYFMGWECMWNRLTLRETGLNSDPGTRQITAWCGMIRLDDQQTYFHGIHQRHST